LKILNIIMTYYPAEAYGGTVALAHSLCRGLAQRGHQVVVYATDGFDKYSRQKQKSATVDGVRVFYFRNISNILAWKRLHLDPGVILALQKKARHFDVMQFHGFRSFENIVGYHYAMKYHIPYVLLNAGSLQTTVGKIRLKRIYDKLFGNRLLRDASRIIVSNQMEREEHLALGARPDQIVEIKNAYDVQAFASLPARGLFRDKYHIKEKHIVLFMGRLHKIKGIDFLVEAFAELVKTRKDVILVIVGPDDGFKPFLVDLINRLELNDKVLFTGFLGGEDKQSVLVDADMLVQTSLFERGPGSPFEAILCNTPVIVSQNTGCAEVVAQLDAGYLVEYGNKPELAARMLRILNDPSEIREKTERTREYIISNLSWEKVVMEYEKVYLQLTAQRRSK
jgi:glycosyltransferase involved in cell wall biosynthesis